MEKDALMTRGDVLQYLRISRGTLLKLMRKGEIPFARLERKLLFRKSDIDGFIEAKIKKADIDGWLETKRIK
jgi:excisionase family DNA binding protein